MTRVVRYSLLMAFLALLTAWPAQAQPTGQVLTCGSGRAVNGLLTLASGQTANGDSANWLRVGAGLHALAVQYVIAPTATVEMFQSLDGGATFTDVNVPDTASTATDGHTIENPIGIYKATVTNFSGGSVTVTARCGASAGGRP